MTKACGILFCYNEEQILPYTLGHYLSQGIDLVIFDNESTDSSLFLIDSARKNNPAYYGRILDVISIKTQGYEWTKILAEACRFMHQHLSQYEWILLIDADAFYDSPVEGMSLTDFINFSGLQGYNVLDGSLLEFYPTEQDDPSIKSPIERLKYYRTPHDTWLEPKLFSQQKIFKYHPSIDFYTMGGHVCLRDRPKLCFIPFIYRHYPWLSYKHGLKKIFIDRKPRYTADRRTDFTSHPQYNELLPMESDLVKTASSLHRLDRKQTMSVQYLTLQMKFRFMLGPVADLKWKFKESWRRGVCSKLRRPIHSFVNLYHYDPLLAFHRLWAWCLRVARSMIGFLMKQQPVQDPPSHRVINQNEIVKQNIFVGKLPQNVHFLMNDRCNVRCVFCNQDFDRAAGKQMTLEQFKMMLSHLPTASRMNFIFSGGGEPLLCEDLFPIIRYVNQNHPAVNLTLRTNGTLLGKYIHAFQTAKLSHLEISFHGGSEDANNLILQKKGPTNIFESIKLLKNQSQHAALSMRISFVMAVSQINIDEVPQLIQKAAELGIYSVTVVFVRYWPAENEGANPWRTAKSEESLYFAQDRYNSVVLQSKKLARKLGVRFHHEPLFGKKFKPTPCFQPWQTLLVDWEGDIYPCTGGEAWFREQVKTNQYTFGNLLRQHIVEIWNSDDYLRVRRTCSRNRDEKLIPGCSNCHNTSCFRGPDVLEGHILKAPAETSFYPTSDLKQLPLGK